MTAYTRHFIKAFTSSVAFTILASLAAYGLRVVLARSLTTAEFGLVYAVFGVYGLLSVLQHLGLDDSIVKHVAQLRLKKRNGAIKDLVLTALRWELLGAIALALLGYISAPWLAASYFGTPEAVGMVRWYAIYVALSPLYSLSLALFRAYQEPQMYAVGEFCKNVLVLLLTVIFLAVGFGALSPVLAFCFLVLIPALLLIPLFIHKHFPSFLRQKSQPTKKLRSSLFRFGLYTIIVNVAGIIIAYTDTTLLTYFRPLEDVGLYNAALPTARVLWLFGSSIAVVLFPLAAELWATRREYLAEGIALVQKYGLLLTLPIAATLFVFPELLLRLLFGAAYSDAATALQILTLASVFYTLGQVNTSALAGMGKQREANRIVWAGAAANLVLGAAMIPLFGINGAGWSTFFAFALIFLLSHGVVHKALPRMRLQWGAIGRIMIAAALSVGILYAFRGITLLGFYTKAIFGCAAAFTLYLMVVWLSGAVRPDEIRMILARMRGAAKNS